MGIIGGCERGLLPHAGVEARAVWVGDLLPFDQLGDDGALSVPFLIGGGGERLLGEMRGGVAEAILCGRVDEVRPLVLDGLTHGLFTRCDNLREDFLLVLLEVALFLFDGLGSHLGEQVVTDVVEIVVIGDEVEDVVAVFAVGSAGAGLIAVEFGDDVFVPGTVSPVEAVRRNDREIDVVPFVRRVVVAAGIHAHGDGDLGARAAGGVLIVDGGADAVLDGVLIGDAALAVVNHAAHVGLLREAMPASAGVFVEEERLLGVFGHGGLDDRGVAVAGGKYRVNDLVVVDAAHMLRDGEAAE